MGDISRDHAESYLRLLAEAALRAAPRAVDSAARAARVRRAADILVDAGILDEAQAEEILLMLAAALSVRGQRGRVALSLVHRISGVPLSTSAPGREARGDDPWRVIRPSAGQVPGSQLMALIITANRMIAPVMLRFPPSAGLTDLAAPSFADLIATDDTGAYYKLNFTDGGWAGSTWTGTILFRPPASPGARTLTVTGPNGPVLRVDLSPDPAAGQPAATATPLADSLGERLLIRRAEAMLGARLSPDTAAARHADVARVIRPLGLSLPISAPPIPVTATGEPDLAEVIEILEGARILSPLSPVPTQLAGLSRALGLSRAPATVTSSAETLPARWRAVLAYYGRRGHEPLASGTGSIGVTLPSVDGARFTVAGVHTGRAGSVLHVVGRGLRPRPRPGQDTRFSWWARDEGSGWHLAILQAWHLAHDEVPMRLVMLPPLRAGDPGSTGTLALEVSGTTSRLTADLIVHW